MLETVILSLLIGGFASFSIGLVLVTFRSSIRRVVRYRDDQFAVQASHVGDPLRFGGLAVTLGMMSGALTLSKYSNGIFTQWLLISALPVFAAGFAEDLGLRVSPLGRFVAAVLAAILAVAVMRLWVPRGDLPGLDAVMAFAPAAILITILIASVFCHSVNLIDGMNGLASVIVITSALGLSFIAYAASMREIAALAGLLAAATIGFMPLNWPVARLFLGDGGAYGLGHILVWLAISMVALSNKVAVPAIILVLFWPFADSIHSVLRRSFADRSILAPDRMHLHQKVMRGIEIVWLGRRRRHIANPVATIVMIPLVSAPVVSGVLLWNQAKSAWIALAVSAGVFGLFHLGITVAARRLRMRGGPALRTEKFREE